MAKNEKIVAILLTPKYGVRKGKLMRLLRKVKKRCVDSFEDFPIEEIIRESLSNNVDRYMNVASFGLTTEMLFARNTTSPVAIIPESGSANFIRYLAKSFWIVPDYMATTRAIDYLLDRKETVIEKAFNKSVAKYLDTKNDGKCLGGCGDDSGIEVFNDNNEIYCIKCDEPQSRYFDFKYYRSTYNPKKEEGKLKRLKK